MEKVDLLLTNALVLTMDEKFTLFDPGAVAVTGDTIVAVGMANELTARYTTDTLIDCGGKVVMPGLINAHTHIPMTLLRGLADDLRLDVWLMGYMLPVEREFVCPDFVRTGTQLGCAEMIRSGVTTFADMYYFEEEIARATADAGMRALCSQTVMKFPTPDAESYEESLALARDFIQRWKGHPLIMPSVAPHAPYTCTGEILRATAELAIEFDVPLHTHIAETALEVQNMRQEMGMPVIPYVKKHGLLETKMLAAHCVHVDEGEIRTMLHAGVGVAHNPTSNLKLASGIAPVKRMLELGLNVGIGTDGAASNNDLDMFEELRLTALIAKNSNNDPTALPAQTTLLMATRLGAKALFMDDITGSLEVGKRADLITIELNTLHNAPRFRREESGPYAQLVYAAKATDVQDVLINGKWVMRARQLLTLNETEILANAQEYAYKIDEFLLHREESVLSKLIAIGGATEEESFEVQAKVPIREIQPVVDALHGSAIEILYKRHYREYDTYFSFVDPSQGRLRVREDHMVDENGKVTNVRMRLTHIGEAREQNFPEGVLLSRSRFLAPATQGLRFYREYFKPGSETEIEKERLRFFIRFENTEFYVNLDTVKKPDLGCFLEVKSRTWSRKDADQKSHLASKLIEYLGSSPKETVTQDYFEIVKQQ